MKVTLYGFKHSHPVLAARLMLRRKQIEHNLRDTMPGTHPIVVRAAGFPGRTVPALRLGDELVQGTLNISRALDRTFPDPPLFPREPAARAAVEEAERWGHDVLQPIAARVFRWAGYEYNAVRVWMTREVVGWPLPDPLCNALKPVMAYFSSLVGATPAAVEADLRGLPAVLDHADSLAASGAIGGDGLNAADCQIFASLRLLAAHADLHGLVTSHRCGQLALAAVPDFPGPPIGALPPVPAVLPPQWLPTSA